MNDATLRRLQERMLEEGYKAPGEDGSNEGDDPAAQDDEHDKQPQQINMYSHQHSPPEPQPNEGGGAGGEEEDDDAAWIAEQVRRHQEYFLQQQRERFDDVADTATSNNNSVNQDDNDDDREDGEDWWNCDSCGYDSAAHLNFCGVCGDAKPHDWFCHSCNFQNSHFHRFCGMCGKVGGDDSVVDEPASVQQSPGSLGYEDMGLPQQQDQPQEDPSIRTNEEEEAAIRAAAERMSRHLRVAPVAPYGDDDDVSSFAGDSCEDDVPLPPQHEHPQQSAPAPTTNSPPTTSSTFRGWCCVFCTFQNENPDFLSCEMCGSARPPTPPGSPAPPTHDLHTVTTATSTRPSSSHSVSRTNDSTNNSRSNVQQQSPPPPPPRRESYGSGSRSSKSDSSDKIKEKRLTEILRLQHLAHTEASLSNNQQQQHPNGSAGQVEPETDHELAMIYAQQERILAEYQRHQRQQQQQQR